MIAVYESRITISNAFYFSALWRTFNGGKPLMKTPANATGISVCLISASLLLSGCGSTKWVDNPPTWLTPYRTDVAQGNFVSQEMADQLSAGMSRDQVRAILGTPLLVDPFRNDRWDYVFEIRRGDGRSERRRFSVFFENGLLASYEGDTLPDESGQGLLPEMRKR